MIGKLRSVVLDAPDIAGLAAFYSDVAGWTQTYADDEWINLDGPPHLRVAFQHAPDLQPPRWPDPQYPQQFHLDLRVADMEGAAARAEKLGAVRLGGGETWQTLADPAGHPFDLCRADEDGFFAVTIDTEDPARLADFYGAMLGLDRLYDGEEGSLLGGPDKPQLMFQKVATHVAPRWPDPAHPQQFHLDVAVSDVDAAEPAVLALGATRLDGEGDNWRVYADPAGHPFCLVW